MRLAGTQFSLPTKSFELYFSGCRGNCIGCHNPELKDFNLGNILTSSDIQEIIIKIKNFNNLIENIWVLGGEPLDQELSELTNLLSHLQATGKKIWLFTRYNIDEVPSEIKEMCDYIKTGKYIDELRSDNHEVYGVNLATTNQSIWHKGEIYASSN